MSNKRRFRRQLDEERTEIARDHNSAAHDLPNWPQSGGRSFGDWWQRRFPHPTRWGEGLAPVTNAPARMIIRVLGVVLLALIVGLIVFTVIHA